MRVEGVLFAVLLNLAAVAQDREPYKASLHFDDSPRGNERFRMAFYNVENLFDTRDDSLTRDDAFTPMGENYYGWEKYRKKTAASGRTILALGGWEPVELIGLCEVENRYVLESLTKYGMLGDDYAIVHEDSPDGRGIDVAALYRPSKFQLLFYEYLRVEYPEDPGFRTRDALYISGILPNKDTLHFFVNHWPSRWGGQFETQEMRFAAARTIGKRVDAIRARNPRASIVITGDLNDYPNDLSVRNVLGAVAPGEPLADRQLVNLSAPIQYKFGSHSFAGEWGVLDHFIVHAPLLSLEAPTRVWNETAMIFDAPWLLKKNAAGNSVSNRFYQGPMYMGGYSDHLPIYLDLDLNPGEEKRATPMESPRFTDQSEE